MRLVIYIFFGITGLERSVYGLLALRIRGLEF